MKQEPEAQAVKYRCPGESSPIGQAVHLGRLARFYPACRRCAHRVQTGTLSSRRMKRLRETRRGGQARPLFHSEGAAGTYLNDLDPASARRMAAALGVCLRRQRSDTSDSPLAIIASDGRPLVPEMVAAVGEGLRWAGCHVADIGAASAPCAAFAIDHQACDGGILVGNPDGRAHTVGLKFWAQGARPLSESEALDTVRRMFETGVDRPTRKYGSLRRLQAEGPYLDGLAGYYHALRPLRFVLQTTCRPVLGYLQQLTAKVACEAIPCPARPDQLADQVRAERAHLAVRIDDDGQRCQIVDERGRPVANEQLLLLVARHLLAEQPGGAIVLEEATDLQVARELCAIGGRSVRSDARRSEMERAMRENGALLGGGPSGRFWYRAAGRHWSADALRTLTLLLEILSQSDRPLSAVLDAEAALR